MNDEKIKKNEELVFNPYAQTEPYFGDTFSSNKEYLEFTKDKRRYFGGKTEDFESKEEKLFEQAHLKAYLKGRDTFRHGPGKLVYSPFSGWIIIRPEHTVKTIWK